MCSGTYHLRVLLFEEGRAWPIWMNYGVRNHGPFAPARDIGKASMLGFKATPRSYVDMGAQYLIGAFQLGVLIPGMKNPVIWRIIIVCVDICWSKCWACRCAPLAIINLQRSHALVF